MMALWPAKSGRRRASAFASLPICRCATFSRPILLFRARRINPPSLYVGDQCSRLNWRAAHCQSISWCLRMRRLPPASLPAPLLLAPALPDRRFRSNPASQRSLRPALRVLLAQATPILLLLCAKAPSLLLARGKARAPACALQEKDRYCASSLPAHRVHAPSRQSRAARQNEGLSPCA